MMKELIVKTTTTRPLSIMPLFGIMWNLDESIMSFLKILDLQYLQIPLPMVSNRLTYKSLPAEAVRVAGTKS